jgi:hypothetical protein
MFGGFGSFQEHHEKLARHPCQATNLWISKFTRTSDEALPTSISPKPDNINTLRPIFHPFYPHNGSPSHAYISAPQPPPSNLPLLHSHHSIHHLRQNHHNQHYPLSKSTQPLRCQPKEIQQGSCRSKDKAHSISYATSSHPATFKTKSYESIETLDYSPSMDVSAQEEDREGRGRIDAV